MPASRKRKNRGKGAEARERQRRRAQRNAAIRASYRGEAASDEILHNMALLGLVDLSVMNPNRSRRP